MRSFLPRFAPVVLGVLSGFDRIIFKGRLPQLYSPQGMNCYASANRVLLIDFKKHAKEITQHVMQASLVEKAKAVWGAAVFTDRWTSYPAAGGVSKWSGA